MNACMINLTETKREEYGDIRIQINDVHWYYITIDVIVIVIAIAIALKDYDFIILTSPHRGVPTNSAADDG